MGYFRTSVLLAAVTALFLGAGFMLGGGPGVLLAFVIALCVNFLAYWNSDKMVLAMYGAREVDRTSTPALYGVVEQLAYNAGLPMPKVHVIENPQPNAFATGRNPENAAVAATTGRLKAMTHEEIAGVMAHELAHVKNRDTLIMTLTAAIAGAVGMLANLALFLGGTRNNPLGLIGAAVLMILAPLAVMLVQMAISRTREYETDKLGAEICARPEWLASALDKLERGAQAIDNQAAENNLASAHMFIVNPLHKHSVDNLFSTHPKTRNRIQRLVDMPARARAGTAERPWG